MFKIELAYSTVLDGNMDFRFGKKHEVENNRQKFFLKNNVDPKKTTLMHIGFGNGYFLVTDKNAGEGVGLGSSTPQADILLTANTGIALGLLTADCAPVILYDESAFVLSLAHVGLLNLAAGTVSEAVKQTRLKSDKDNLFLRAIIGPHIREKSYFFDEIPSKYAKYKYLFKIKDGKYHCNLTKEIISQLEASGVYDIAVDKHDTYDGQYFSHRRSYMTGEPEGRFLTCVRLESDVIK